MALKLAIVGYGDEGRSAYTFFAAQGADITIFDEAESPKYQVPAGVKFVHGPNSFQQLSGFDKVLRGSPAIRPDSLKTDGEITSATKEFLRLCPTKNIIGVTATKGKGTMVSLIAAILQNASKQAYVVGNIGVPALDVLPKIRPNDIVVFELSSFQLWDVTSSPHIAVVGMIEPEHLEIHRDMQEYVQAKGNIARFQTPDDVLIYHPTNTYSAEIAAGSKARTKIRFQTAEGAHVQGETIVIDGQAICSTTELRIPGPHNIDNACAALTAAWQYTTDATAAREAITTFTGLEHRLEFVREFRGVKYYNDSISTTPGSVIAAINAFTPAHELLIIGGTYDKGADFSELATQLAALRPKKVFFVGVMGAKIAELAVKAGYAHGEVHQKWSMQQVVQLAASQATDSDVVILSPATASFGDFINYKARGQQFKDIVCEL